MGFNPLDIAKKIFEAFLKPLLAPLRSIIEGALKLVEFLVILLSKVPAIIQIAVQIFNPVNILNDSITGIFMGIQILFKGIIDALNPRNIFGKGKYDKCKDTGSGLFGMRRPVDKKGKLVNGKKVNDRKCVPPTLFRMIMLIICPPFALFQHVGLSNGGWFNVIVCILLTVYGYYFPGLIYAILHILC